MPDTIVIHLQTDDEPGQIVASVRPTEDRQPALELTGAGQTVVFWPVDPAALREMARQLETIAGAMEKGAQRVTPGSADEATAKASQPKATPATPPAAALEAVQKAIERRGPRRKPPR